VDPERRPLKRNPQSIIRGLLHLPCGTTGNLCGLSAGDYSSQRLGKSNVLPLVNERRACLITNLCHSGSRAATRLRGDLVDFGLIHSRSTSALLQPLLFRGGGDGEFGFSVCQHGPQRDSEGNERLVEIGGAIYGGQCACVSEERVARPSAMFLRWIVVFGALACVALPSAASEHRSREVTREFQREHPCPSTGANLRRLPRLPEGSHRAARRGGPDAVWNLQWQTIAAAKIKDRREPRACGR
jgi:hypothetical protein